jgi:hypothetical protein
MVVGQQADYADGKAAGSPRKLGGKTHGAPNPTASPNAERRHDPRRQWSGFSADRTLGWEWKVERTAPASCVCRMERRHLRPVLFNDIPAPLQMIELFGSALSPSW